jgi:putative acyl-CoA dehydrogenase
MPRLYREAPLYSIWEGSGNVICLDVLRTLAKDPAAIFSLLREMQLAPELGKRVANFLARLEASLRRQAEHAGEGGADLQREARILTERAALLLQASLLIRYSSPAIAEAFCASRLDGEGGFTFGTLPQSANVEAILDRVSAKLANT